MICNGISLYSMLSACFGSVCCSVTFLAIASLAMLSKSQRNKQSALNVRKHGVTTDDDVDLLVEWAMSWRQKRSAIGDPLFKLAIGDSTVGTLRPVVEIKMVLHINEVRSMKKEGLLVNAGSQWHLYFYESPGFTHDIMFRRIAEHPMTAPGPIQDVKDVWSIVNSSDRVHHDHLSPHDLFFQHRCNFSVQAGYSQKDDGEPDEMGRQMSHAWMTLSSGRWRSANDGGQWNMLCENAHFIIANTLCEIAGFEFPYPHVFEDVELLPELWKKEGTSDACGSAARSSNNVAGVVEDVCEVVRCARLAIGSVSVDISSRLSCPDDAIYCPTCEFYLNGKDQYGDHLKGKKHKKNAKRTRAERGLPATVTPQQHVENESACQVSWQTDLLVNNMRCFFPPAKIINLMLATQAVEEALEAGVVTAAVADPAEVFLPLFTEHHPLAVGSTHKEEKNENPVLAISSASSFEDASNGTLLAVGSDADINYRVSPEMILNWNWLRDFAAVSRSTLSSWYGWRNVA
jgi:hypothetical protein